MAAAGGIPLQTNAQHRQSCLAPEGEQGGAGRKGRTEVIDPHLTIMHFKPAKQQRTQSVPVQLGMDGDTHHPGVAAPPRRFETGVGQQRLGQQMAARTAATGPDRLGQLGLYLPFPRHQRHSQQARILLQQMDVEIRTLKQGPEIARRSLVVSQHQQAEQLVEQLLVARQRLLTDQTPARAGRRQGSCHFGIEAEQAENQRLQRIALTPANGLREVDLLPLRGLAIEHPLETQVKTAPRPFVTVLGGGKHDATVAGQHSLKQRGRNGSRFIHQQQIGIHRLVHQPIRRAVAQSGQLFRRGI